MFNYQNKLDVRKGFDSSILLKPLRYEVMASTLLRGPILAAILASHTPQLSGRVSAHGSVAKALRNRLSAQYSKPIAQ